MKKPVLYGIGVGVLAAITIVALSTVATTTAYLAKQIKDTPISSIEEPEEPVEIDETKPYVGPNGNWWIYGQDTGISADGPILVDVSNNYEVLGGDVVLVTVLTFNDGTTHTTYTRTPKVIISFDGLVQYCYSAKDEDKLIFVKVTYSDGSKGTVLVTKEICRNIGVDNFWKVGTHALNLRLKNSDVQADLSYRVFEDLAPTYFYGFQEISQYAPMIKDSATYKGITGKYWNNQANKYITTSLIFGGDYIVNDYRVYESFGYDQIQTNIIVHSRQSDGSYIDYEYPVTFYDQYYIKVTSAEYVLDNVAWATKKDIDADANYKVDLSNCYKKLTYSNGQTALIPLTEDDIAEGSQIDYTKYDELQEIPLKDLEYYVLNTETNKFNGTPSLVSGAKLKVYLTSADSLEEASINATRVETDITYDFSYDGQNWANTEDQGSTIFLKEDTAAEQMQNIRFKLGLTITALGGLRFIDVKEYRFDEMVDADFINTCKVAGNHFGDVKARYGNQQIVFVGYTLNVYTFIEKYEKFDVYIKGMKYIDASKKASTIPHIPVYFKWSNNYAAGNDSYSYSEYNRRDEKYGYQADLYLDEIKEFIITDLTTIDWSRNGIKHLLIQDPYSNLVDVLEVRIMNEEHQEKSNLREVDVSYGEYGMAQGKVGQTINELYYTGIKDRTSLRVYFENDEYFDMKLDPENIDFSKIPVKNGKVIEPGMYSLDIVIPGWGKTGATILTYIAKDNSRNANEGREAQLVKSLTHVALPDEDFLVFSGTGATIKLNLDLYDNGWANINLKYLNRSDDYYIDWETYGAMFDDMWIKYEIVNNKVYAHGLNAGVYAFELVGKNDFKQVDLSEGANEICKIKVLNIGQWTELVRYDNGFIKVINWDSAFTSKEIEYFVDYMYDEATDTYSTSLYDTTLTGVTYKTKDGVEQKAYILDGFVDYIN